MSKPIWTDEFLENHLRADAPLVVAVSPELRERTLAGLATRGPSRRFPSALTAAAAALALLLLLPATLLALDEGILGVHVTISDLSPQKWLERGFSGWLESPGTPEFLSPEETAQIATFPIRTPSWLPEGVTPNDQPRGYYAHLHTNGRWILNGGDFGVTQGFTGEPGLSIMQQERRVGGELQLAPGTEKLTVAGHPAFLQRDVPFALADRESEARAKKGQLPEIVDHKNELKLWVAEANGSVTEITLLSELDPETLIRIAESLFE